MAMISPTKIAVYTYSSGRYDFETSPVIVCDPALDVTFYWYSLSGREGGDGWVRRVPPKELSGASGKVINRCLKMQPPAEVQGSDFSLYIDGNVVLGPAFFEGLKPMLDQPFDIGLFRHVDRFSARQEVAECAARGLISVDQRRDIDRHMTELEQSGWPVDQSTLYWGGLILRRSLASDRLRQAMDDWTREFETFPSRDQFWLPYVLWKNKLDVLQLTDLFTDRQPYLPLRHRKGTLLSDWNEGRKVKARVRKFFSKPEGGPNV